jgi:uncharacterized membrane protein YadS
MAAVGGWLTIIAMAALGLGVDVRMIRRVGGPVLFAMTISLIVLVAISSALIWLLCVG